MSRAERIERIRRELSAMRSAVQRAEGEVYGVKQKLDALEAEFAALENEGES